MLLKSPSTGISLRFKGFEHNYTIGRGTEFLKLLNSNGVEYLRIGG